MSDRQKTCAERWHGEKESTFADLRALWESYCNGEDEHPELGSVYDYGLAFDYVSPDTFSDQPDGYFRYQLSWGGPSDEIRYYIDPWDAEADPYHVQPGRVTYVFLDWFDGEQRELRGDDRRTALDYFDWFQQGGAIEAEIERADWEYPAEQE